MPSEEYCNLVAEHRLNGLMGRRGNPYDNAKAEGFMKALQVEELRLAAHETFTGDIEFTGDTERFPQFRDHARDAWRLGPPGNRRPARFERDRVRLLVRSAV